MVLSFDLPTARKTMRYSSKECSLVWKITHKCNIRCKHCFQAERRAGADLSFNDCLEVLAYFRKFLYQNNLIGQITFTGGDPLLRADFMDILAITGEYLRGDVISQISITGNSTKITPEIAREMSLIGVSRYVLSLDGLEATHDYLRRPGSFKQTLYALKCLRDNGITTKIDFTLSRLNASEIADCLCLAAAEGAGIFSFGLLIPAGNGINLKSTMLNPQEYRVVLIKLIDFFDKSPEIAIVFRPFLLFAKPLFARAYYELGRWEEYQKLISRPDYLLFASSTDNTINFCFGWSKPIKPGFFQKAYEVKKQALLKGKPEAFDKFTRCQECPAISYCLCRKMCFIGYHQEDVLHPLCWVG